MAEDVVDWEKKYHELRAYNKEMLDKVIPELIAIKEKIESLR